MIIAVIERERCFMNNNINKKLEEILSGADMSKLKGGSVANFLGSKEGEKLVKQLGSLDKEKLMQAFSGMDTNEVKNRLSKADLGVLSKMSADDIVNRLKKL